MRFRSVPLEAREQAPCGSESVIAHHEHRPATRAFKYPHATLQVRDIGGGGEVLLLTILSPPAPESLNDAMRLRFRRSAARRATSIHRSARPTKISSRPPIRCGSISRSVCQEVPCTS
jgi:hypothetical protein